MSKADFYDLRDQINDDHYIYNDLIRFLDEEERLKFYGRGPSYLLEDWTRFLPEHRVDEYVDYLRRQKYDGIGPEIEEYEDEDGDTVYVIPGIKFTGDGEFDMKQLDNDPQISDWLNRNLRRYEAVTDSKMLIVYDGPDVKDYLQWADQNRLRAQVG